MFNIKFDPKFSVGNVVTVVVVVFAASGSWFTMVNRQAALDEKLASQAQAIASSRADRISAIGAHEARIRALEISMASQTSDLRNIQQTLGEIKQSIDKIALKP